MSVVVLPPHDAERDVLAIAKFLVVRKQAGTNTI